jgi:hypothetical protein
MSNFFNNSGITQATVGKFGQTLNKVFVKHKQPIKM